MKRSDVKELHYITHIDNLKSICEHGVLCHNRAMKMKFTSVANGEIQKRREKVVIPGGKRKLHSYANLYFNARNAMMFKRKGMHKVLCVLKLNLSILDKPDVIISDQNASSGYVLFDPSPQGLENLNLALVYANDWRHIDKFEYYRRKSAVCAEVLVPDYVEPKFITGIYVSCKGTYQKVKQLLEGSPLAEKISINPKLFFQEG